jgi:two-component system NtrC family sensor kinase
MGAPGLKSDKTDSEVSGMQRKGVTYEHLAGMIDCLLVALCRLPPDADVEEASSTILATVADRLLDTAVGATIQGGEAGPLVIARSPRGRKDQPEDPARLFPEYAFERVASIDDGAGSTLHIASDDEADLLELEVLVDRLSLALLGAIHRGRAYERARAQAAELSDLRAQVIQSEKLASLGQIAAGIVHELNNPLTSIIAYADYLGKKARKGGGDPMDIERLTRIQEAADRILRFSRDLTDYTRPSSEERGTLSLHEVVDRALIFCEHLLEQGNITVDRAFEDVRPIRGVAGQLTQVFVNLFTNAAHAMRGHGGNLGVSIAMSPSGRDVVVTICDDGHGIDAEHLSLIFEPFFTTKTDGSGTGLGLSIVRDIILRHGGRIRADSRTAKGTVFTIDLPALGPDAL